MQYIQLQGQTPGEMDTPLSGSYNLFADSLDGTIKMIDSEGNWYGSGGGLVEITYSALRTLGSDNALVPGTYYLITDFKTCYDQPDFNDQGIEITTGNYKQASVSPIIVFAIDQNSLAADAYQPEFPGDKIRYDISFNRTEVTDSPAFGRITYRKDDRGNEFDYDFRTVLFKRYDAYFSEVVYEGTVSIEEIDDVGVVTGVGTSFENFETGEIIGILDLNTTPIVYYYEIESIEDNLHMTVVGNRYRNVDNTRLLDANLMQKMSWKRSNIPSNTSSAEFLTFTDITLCFNNTCANTPAYTLYSEETFLLPNNVFKSPNEDTYTDNSFGSYFRNNTFSEGLLSNKIMDSFYNNIINNDFDNNIITDNFYDNIIDCDFRNNTINGEFHDNHFGDDDEEDFDYNTIHGDFYQNFYDGDENFEYNVIKDDFYENIILNEFSKNTLNGFYENVVEGDFGDNIVGENFNQNFINGDFRENIIGDEVYNNNFFSSFERNLMIGDSVYANNFYSSVRDNQIGSNFYDNNIGEPDDYGSVDFNRNKIGNSFYDNIIAQNFNENQIGSNSYDNTFYSNVRHNTIGADFHENTIGEMSEGSPQYIIQSDFEFNHIGYEFKGNLILGDFSKNRIANFFAGNQIAYNFDGNVIGNQFASNDIGPDFEDNTIENYFFDNSIGSYFKNNKIGNTFFSNNIGNSFGRGVDGQRRGNVIGNDFQDNDILDYFWDNNIGNEFMNNDIGSQFQYNRIETSVQEVDFTSFLGRINNVSFSTTAGTNGTYPGLTGSTSGIGVNATFEVVVTNNSVDSVNITTEGTLYEINDTVTIRSSSFGGGTDLVLDVTDISSTPMVYEGYNKTIQKRFDGTPMLVSLTDNNEWYISQQITEPID